MGTPKRNPKSNAHCFSISVIVLLSVVLEQVGESHHFSRYELMAPIVSLEVKMDLRPPAFKHVAASPVRLVKALVQAYPNLMMGCGELA